MTTTVMVPAGMPTLAPRGARVAADLAARLWNLARGAFATTAPRVRTRAEEAAEVREYASRLGRHDARFAADLFAAADRHELSQG